MRFRVTGEWIVDAASKIQAEDLIENAVAGQIGNVELEDCNAELYEDEEETES